MNKNKTVMLFFLASEAFFFLALIMAYVYYSHPGGNLSPTARYLDFKKTGFFTFLLLASSLTIWLAGRKQDNGKRTSNIVWLGITIILGIIFLFGQGSEYARLIQTDVTISRDVFGSAFFTLTGFHGLHVIMGLIALSILAIMLFSGRFKSVESTVFESVSLYWHFVDVVWIVVFSAVYIGAIL
ncbi:MAG: cytochrome c oxidase subunit 3 [Calditrichaceae bacterium]|jgi:heme/copper-type cytochrome/quinol oxidase subunit 3